MSYWLVGVGGMAGAMMRYGVGLMLPLANDGQFPYSTLLVNWSGSFLLACLLQLTAGSSKRGEALRQLIGTGLIGAYTTFSAFSADTLRLLQAGVWPTALLYAGGTLLGGLLLAWLGDLSGRSIMARRADRQGGRA